MRHEAFMARMCSDVPKSMRKKSKASKEEGEPQPKALPSSLVELLFERDSAGLYAMYNDSKIRLDTSSPTGVSEGETWKCMLYQAPVTKMTTVMAVQKVPKEEVDAMFDEYEVGDEVPAEPEETVTIAAEPENTEDVPVQTVQPVGSPMLEEENKKLNDTIRDLRKKVSALEAVRTECEVKDSTIKEQKTKIDSLKTQVKKLNEKDSVKDALAKESEIAALGEKIESQELEIYMLREQLKKLNIDDLKVVPRLPPVLKATLTGEKSIQCTFFREGRYSVFVSPRLRKLRIVPDENGKVTCRGGSLTIRCIEGFANFEKVRPLKAVEEGDAILIDL